MGAGKPTVGGEVAARLGRRFVDVDRTIEERAGMSISELFKTQGEPEFRRAEAAAIHELLAAPDPSVLALGGGAVTHSETRELLQVARTVLVIIDVDTAWERVRGTNRPLAQDEGDFRRLYDERQPLYVGVADAVAMDGDGVILAAGGIHDEPDALDRLPGRPPRGGPPAPCCRNRVLGLYGRPCAPAAAGPRRPTR